MATRTRNSESAPKVSAKEHWRLSHAAITQTTQESLCIKLRQLSHYSNEIGRALSELAAHVGSPTQRITSTPEVTTSTKEDIRAGVEELFAEAKKMPHSCAHRPERPVEALSTGEDRRLCERGVNPFIKCPEIFKRQQWKVLCLRYDEGLSNKDTAKRLGLSESTTSGHYTAALRAYRKYLRSNPKVHPNI